MWAPPYKLSPSASCNLICPKWWRNNVTEQVFFPFSFLCISLIKWAVLYILSLLHFLKSPCPLPFGSVVSKRRNNIPSVSEKRAQIEWFRNSSNAPNKRLVLGFSLPAPHRGFLSCVRTLPFILWPREPGMVYVEWFLSFSQCHHQSEHQKLKQDCCRLRYRKLTEKKKSERGKMIWIFVSRSQNKEGVLGKVAVFISHVVTTLESVMTTSQVLSEPDPCAVYPEAKRLPGAGTCR